jgi:hypothetical protein
MREPVKTDTITELVTKNDINPEKKTNMKETITNKKQITKRVVSLIITHQARIRCFLDMIIKGKRIEKKEDIFDKIKNNKKINNSIIAVKNTINKTFNKNPIEYPYIEDEKEEKEIRFKNCSVLRLCINKETGVCLQLVHEGELDPGEGKGGRSYYITNNSKETVVQTLDKPDDIKQIIFENINTGLNRLGLKSNDFLKDIDEYVFYIGRHGQAEHNLKRATHLITDTDVTDLGKEQAFRAGKKLITVLKNNNEYINYVFASDLMRTRQTIENILKGMNETQNKIYFPKEIIILPCSHELKYNSKGLCDKKEFIKIGIKENDPKCSKTTYCTGNNIENPNSNCNQITIVINNFHNKIIKKIPLNWDFYFKKNENKLRNMDCSKTNMIKLAIEYINTSVPININENVLTTTKIITEPLSLVNDDCLAECMNNLFFDNSTTNIEQIKESIYFKIFKEFFKDVYDTKDFDKKKFNDFLTFIGSDTSDYDNKQRDEDNFNTLVQCLIIKCGKKISPPSPPEEPVEEPEPLPEKTRENPQPPLPKKTKTSTNGSDKNVNNNMKSALFWYQSFNNNPEIFYNKIKNIARKDDTRDLFDEIMDRIIESSENFYKMIQEYKINQSNDIGFIIDYLGPKLEYNHENALKFMDYIAPRDINLYNEIKNRKQQGGKKTRKNRKAKKRFVKRTKRNHKKNKTRRGRRKTM